MAQKFTLQKLHFSNSSIYWKACNDFLTRFADSGSLPPAAGDDSIQNGVQSKLYSLCLTLLNQIRDLTQEVNVTRRKHCGPFLSCNTFIHWQWFCLTAAWCWSDEQQKGSLQRMLPPSSLTHTSGGSLWKSNCLSHLQAMLKLNKYQITSDMVLSLPPSIPSGFINNLYWLCRVIHH